MATRTVEDLALTAHLLRRVGFGPTYEEVKACAAKGYEAAVEELLNPESQPGLDEPLLARLNIGWLRLETHGVAQTYWMYRLIHTPRPLEEKIALFWHGVLCTGYAKVDWARQSTHQMNIYRRIGLGNFRDILAETAREPAMVWYLDNCISHMGAINENWGRELLELFSMGVGNYTEVDVKEASRAFTGWTNDPTFPPFPNGRRQWQFFYDPTDHDQGEKAFLGYKGQFNGEDVIDLICRQPATARFVARQLYSFFVADEPPVPQWGNTPARDPAAIETLTRVYLESNYDTRAILRELFNSDFFKNALFQKVKSPAELVAGTIRLVKDYDIPKPGFYEDVLQECTYMGQDLLNPPSVEGWHTGSEWLDSGTLLDRINFVSRNLGDLSKRGVQEIAQRLRARGQVLSAESLVDGCLEQLAFVEVKEDTRGTLVAHAQKDGEIRTDAAEFPTRMTEMLQLIVASKEYQFA